MQSSSEPLHIPQLSATASPPQTPSQSTSTKQLPSQSKFSSEYSQEPLSAVAESSKLHAEESRRVIEPVLMMQPLNLQAYQQAYF